MATNFIAVEDNTLPVHDAEFLRLESRPQSNYLPCRILTTGSVSYALCNMPLYIVSKNFTNAALSESPYIYTEYQYLPVLLGERFKFYKT